MSHHRRRRRHRQPLFGFPYLGTLGGVFRPRPKRFLLNRSIRSTISLSFTRLITTAVTTTHHHHQRPSPPPHHHHHTTITAATPPSAPPIKGACGFSAAPTGVRRVVGSAHLGALGIGVRPRARSGWVNSEMGFSAEEGAVWFAVLLISKRVRLATRVTQGTAGEGVGLWVHSRKGALVCGLTERVCRVCLLVWVGLAAGTAEGRGCRVGLQQKKPGCWVGCWDSRGQPGDKGCRVWFCGLTTDKGASGCGLLNAEGAFGFQTVGGYLGS
ncbi:hypothetical protein Tco_1567965 [Tanacetum coccineum]